MTPAFQRIFAAEQVAEATDDYLTDAVMEDPILRERAQALLNEQVEWDEVRNRVMGEIGYEQIVAATRRAKTAREQAHRDDFRAVGLGLHSSTIYSLRIVDVPRFVTALRGCKVPENPEDAKAFRDNLAELLDSAYGHASYARLAARHDQLPHEIGETAARHVTGPATTLQEYREMVDIDDTDIETAAALEGEALSIADEVQRMRTGYGLLNSTILFREAVRSGMVTHWAALNAMAAFEGGGFETLDPQAAASLFDILDHVQASTSERSHFRDAIVMAMFHNLHVSKRNTNDIATIQMLNDVADTIKSILIPPLEEPPDLDTASGEGVREIPFAVEAAIRLALGRLAEGQTANEESGRRLDAALLGLYETWEGSTSPHAEATFASLAKAQAHLARARELAIEAEERTRQYMNYHGIW